MQESNIDFDNVTAIAYKVASQYIYDKDSANDIAQLTAIECYMNSEKLRAESLNSWIYVVAKNKSIDLIKNKKKERDLQDKKFQYLVNQEIDFSYQTIEDLDDLIENTPNKVIPIKQKQLMREVLNSNYDFRKVAAKFKMNYHTLRKKTYKIQQEILFYQKIIKGHKRTRPIPGTKLHENILNFAKKLKAHFNEKDMSLFDKINIDEHTCKTLSKINIGKVISYQITILVSNFYEIFIPYQDEEKNHRCIWIEIRTDNNKIFITSPPKTPSKILKVKRENLPHPINKTFKDGPDGEPSISEEELLKKLAECNEVVEIIYEDKNK
jgi:DNA-directed RNA polymerase specialized sigma24 family protein